MEPLGSRKIKKKTLVDCTKFVQRDMDVTEPWISTR